MDLREFRMVRMVAVIICDLLPEPEAWVEPAGVQIRAWSRGLTSVRVSDLELKR